MQKSYKLFYIFIITSICGYFIEFIWTLLTKGIILNHSLEDKNMQNFMVENQSKIINRDSAKDLVNFVLERKKSYKKY